MLAYKRNLNSNSLEYKVRSVPAAHKIKNESIFKVRHRNTPAAPAPRKRPPPRPKTAEQKRQTT